MQKITSRVSMSSENIDWLDSSVVFAPLFYAQVCIDASIAGCACEVFVFSVGYVLSCPVVPVFFGQTKVNEEQLQRKIKRLILN